MAPLTSLPLPTYITEGMDWPLLHWDQEDALNSSSPSDDYPHEALPTMLHASAAKAKAHAADDHLTVNNTGTDKRSRNRQAQARYRERQRDKNSRNEKTARMLTQSLEDLAKAQAALQAERDAFAAEKQRWQASAPAKTGHMLQLTASDGDQDFVLDPNRHSLAVVRQKMAERMMPYLNVKIGIFKESAKILGWENPCVRLTDDLNTAMFEWVVAFKQAMRHLLELYDAQPTEENLANVTHFIDGLKTAFKIYWDNTLEGESWPQTLLSACAAAIVGKWGEPMANHYRRCVDAMRLNPEQKANIVKAYRRWQEQTAAAQHRSAHILPGMQVLQNRSMIEMTFMDRKLSEQLLHKCEMEQKRAAAELFFSFTAQLTPYQHARMEVTCQPYRSDALKLCEAVEQSLVGDSFKAALERPDLPTFMTEELTPTHNPYDFGPSAPSLTPPADAEMVLQISQEVLSGTGLPSTSLPARSPAVAETPVAASCSRDAVPRSLSNSGSSTSQGAAPQQQQNAQQSTASGDGSLAETAALADAGVSTRDGLQGDAVLDDILQEFAGSLPEGNETGLGMRQDSWDLNQDQLQDLSMGLDVRAAEEMLQVLNA